TIQTRAPQSPQTVRNTNPHVSTSIGLNHKTNVSIPQHRSNQLKDKVVPNNSQVKLKKTQVEEHPRISSISNKIKSITTCNDSLNSKTSNVNDVCATCKKCLVDSYHFACVTQMLNDVNARTKKPNVVPISTRKHKGHANKSVATPHKKKVASKSSNQKPQSYYRMLYEKTSKTWKWWIEQQSPSGYKWVLKTKMQWVPKAKNENVQKRGSFAIIQLILFIVDSGCTKYMMGNLKSLCNFVEKFLGNVRFGNDQFAPILDYRDLVQGNIMSNRVYYVKGLNYNLFSVGYFCDANLERHKVLKQDTQCIFKEEGIEHQTSTARTPEQNGVVEQRNGTLVEAAPTMLLTSKLPLFFWVEAITTDQFRAPTAQDMEILIQTCLMPLALKTQNDSFIFVHEFKQEMHAHLKYVESLKKEINELKSDKAEFSNIYDMILQECVSNDVICSYLFSLSDLDVLAELQCLYLNKVKECDCLAQNLLKQIESVSKEVHTELLQCFAKVEKHLIYLEIALQKCKEHVKNETVWNEQASNVFQKEREQYIEIQDLKAQLNGMKSACSKLDLIFNSLVADMKDKLHSFTPLGKTGNSFSAFESGEDQGDNGDAGGEDIASSLTISESDQAGIGTGAGIEILAVIRYAECGSGVAADSSLSNGSVSSANGAWSAAVEATTTESVGAGCSSSSSSSASMSISSSSSSYDDPSSSSPSSPPSTR
nr:putative ribonuclease H-like domain-containing protein [Tanacetum cinerariifolium]